MATSNNNNDDDGNNVNINGSGTDTTPTTQEASDMERRQRRSTHHSSLLHLQHSMLSTFPRRVSSPAPPLLPPLYNDCHQERRRATMTTPRPPPTKGSGTGRSAVAQEAEAIPSARVTNTTSADDILAILDEVIAIIDAVDVDLFLSM